MSCWPETDYWILFPAKIDFFFFPAKMVLFEISRELQFRIYNHDESCKAGEGFIERKRKSGGLE